MAKRNKLVVAVLPGGVQDIGKSRRKTLDPSLRGAIRKPPRRADGSPSRDLSVPKARPRPPVRRP
jgi:hypothetical protein